MQGPGDEDLDEFGLGYDRPDPAAPAPASPAAPGGPWPPRQAAPRPHQDLSAALWGLQASRFNRHAPVSEPVRAAYRDTTALSISCEASLSPGDWTSDGEPTFFGVARGHETFKPEKLIAEEALIYQFQNSSGSVEVVVEVQDAGDLELYQLFIGNRAALAPSLGLSGRAMSHNSLGGGVSLPTVNPGVDINAGFKVRETALYRAMPPQGYTQADLVRVRVRARLTLFGRSLR